MAFHFKDTATGLCVQTLDVSHFTKAKQEVVDDLIAHLPAGRTLIDTGVDTAHVCAPLPADPNVAKRDRLDALRAKGFANLTPAEKQEAQGLRFDLGLGS